MKTTPKNDEKFDNYLNRFFDLIEYFLSRVEPIEQFGLLADTKNVTDAKPKINSIIIDPSHPHRLPLKNHSQKTQ